MSNSNKAHKAGVSRRQEKKGAQSRRRLWGWVAAGIIVLVLAGYGVAMVQAAQATIPGVQTYTGLSFEHTTAPVKYAQNPPVGGDHNPVWLNCGIYDQPVPNENAVHSLEHGAVWVTYQPSLPSAAVEQLRQLVRGREFVILSPYDNLPAPVVASAWGVQLQLTGADDTRLSRFLKKYVLGPQTREMGGVCTGGLGNPIP
jgi:hypothetical protein